MSFWTHRFWTHVGARFLGGRARKLTELAEEVAGYWPHLPGLEAQIRQSIRRWKKP